MIVGTEWLIEAVDADENALRDIKVLREIFACIIADLNLKTLGKGFWHQFPDERGVTGFVALTESHLACHTYPEHQIATFNLYCCRTRPMWNWKANLKEMLGAKAVNVLTIERGESKISNLKSQIAGGER